MDNNGLSLFAILFLVFLGLSAALIIRMFVSLVHLGMSGGSRSWARPAPSPSRGWWGTSCCAPWCSCWGQEGAPPPPSSP